MDREQEVIRRITSQFSFRRHFPHQVKAATGATRAGDEPRLDYRRFDFVTIDGEDSKDFDDAVCCLRNGNGWILRVAIADVSSYVAAGSPLDKEARIRATSVYFPNHVIPMLPPVLSEDKCSLIPNADRKCLVCEIHIGDDGVIRQYRIARALIRSRQRLTYRQVDRLLKQQHPAISVLGHCAEALQAHRARRGALFFEAPEVSLRLNGNSDNAVSIRYRTFSHKIIEEAMLAANVCAADFLYRHGAHGLYRIHDQPKPEAVRHLAKVLAAIGVDVPTIRLASDFLPILNVKNERLAPAALGVKVISSINRARYQPDPSGGHFGLALRRYTHFTSPIRRYPDLLVHRIINAILSGQTPPDVDYATVGRHCTETEQQSDKAQWHVKNVFACVLAKKYIGAVFPGHITGVCDFGVFVYVPSRALDGLVRISDINGYFRYHADIEQLSSAGGRRYHIAQKVRVKLVAVNEQKGRANFIFV